MDSDLYAQGLREILNRLAKGYELHKKDKELMLEALVHLLEKKNRYS